MRPTAIAAVVPIAASANDLAKAGYAIGFGGLAAAERPAFLLAALALLGFAAAAAYLMHLLVGAKWNRTHDLSYVVGALCH